MPLTEESRAQLRHVKIGRGEVDLARFPDFMIVGPQRTGTTWLYRNLQHHPHVLLPVKKETYYFSTLGNPGHHRHQFKNLQDYLALFRDSPKRILKRNYDSLRRSFTFYRPRITGEATATYATLSEEIIREIALLNPDLKVILMLRDPVERAWSHAKKDYRKAKRKSSTVPLGELETYFARIGQKRLADFPRMIKNWAQHLRPGHLFLATFEELGTDSPALLSAVCDFLDIPSGSRYFHRRHLTEKINPTTASAMPDPVRGLLDSAFATERTTYQNLLEEIATTRNANTATAAGQKVSVVPISG